MTKLWQMIFSKIFSFLPSAACFIFSGIIPCIPFLCFYIFWVSLFSLIKPTCNENAPNYHVFRVWFYYFYPLYLMKLRVQNRCIEHCTNLLVSLNICFVCFFIITWIKRDIVIHLQFSLCEVPPYVCKYLVKYNLV